MVTVHKDRNLDLVGWYTLLPPSGPTATTLSIHTQFLEGFNESAILLGFHPLQAQSQSVGGNLPLTIYESNYEVDDPKAEQDGEDKTMDDGDHKLRMKFRELPYSVESDETEMIGMNYVTSGGGSAAATGTTLISPMDDRPPRIESNGKGKRRLLDSTDGSKDVTRDSALTRAEDEMIASLTTKANAIKMLQSRIQLLTKYLDQLDPAYDCGADPAEYTSPVAPSLGVLRQIQALVSRLPLVIPSDRKAFEKEVQQETNDVYLVTLLSDILGTIAEARDVSRKFNVVDSSRSQGRRGDNPVAYTDMV